MNAWSYAVMSGNTRSDPRVAVGGGSEIEWYTNPNGIFSYYREISRNEFLDNVGTSSRVLK